MKKFDKTLTCHDCGENFTFSAKDQIFYEEKGFPQPKRCRKCRRLRKNLLNKKMYEQS